MSTAKITAVLISVMTMKALMNGFPAPNAILWNTLPGFPIETARCGRSVPDQAGCLREAARSRAWSERLRRWPAPAAECRTRGRSCEFLRDRKRVGEGKRGDIW